MDIYELLKDSLSLLISDNKYSIEVMEYSEGCFGNIWLVLKSSISANIQFVRDRDVMSCNVGLGVEAQDQWLGIKSVFKILELDFPSLPEDTYDFIIESCKLIKDNEDLLIRLKNPVFFHDLEKRIIKRNKEQFMKKY